MANLNILVKEMKKRLLFRIVPVTNGRGDVQEIMDLYCDRFSCMLLFASALCNFASGGEKVEALPSQLSGKWKLVETIAVAKRVDDSEMRDCLIDEKAVEHVSFGPKKISFFSGNDKKFSFADPLRFSESVDENTFKFVRGGGDRTMAATPEGELPPLVAESFLYVRVVEKDLLLVFFGENFKRDPLDVRLLTPGDVIWILRKGT